MSWINMLYETYLCNSKEVGKKELTEHGNELPVLMPICHSTANFHLEIAIDNNAEVIPHTGNTLSDKQKCVTILPCTEASQSRSGSNPKNHPLFDKLQYLAGDYTSYGGEKGEHFHKNYMDDLKAWCESPFAHPRVCLLYDYLKKGTLIQDLIKEKQLPQDDAGKLIRKWSKEYGEKKGVFQAGSVLSDSLDAMLRINVLNLSPAPQKPLWEDDTVWNSFIQFYLSCQDETDLCYVQGLEIPCSAISPNKIRHAADKGKLISANDSSGFTYRGRFSNDDKAVKIGYEITQKAHNALKWLLEKQGFHYGDLYYVVWGCHNPILPPLEDNDYLFNEEENETSEIIDTHEEYGKQIAKLMAGYRSQWTQRENVMILGLDSATTGRLSLVHYQEVEGNEYLDRLTRWYESVSWHLYYKKSDKDSKSFRAMGTPTPKEIIDVLYGSNASDKLKKSTMQRILHCIFHESPIPQDFMQRATERVIKPTALESWQYQRYLPITCALVRKYYNKKEEIYTMGLDENNMERDYLFGRVLAYYHHIESLALYKKGEKERATNALRLKYQFTRRPASTSMVLDRKIRPYVAQLGSYLDLELSKIRGNIPPEAFNDQKLSPIFLLGYDCQLVELKKKKAEDKGE